MLGNSTLYCFRRLTKSQAGYFKNLTGILFVGKNSLSKGGACLPGVVEVKVKVPSDLVGLLKPRRVEDEVKLLVALELYREGKVSLGKAAGIAGLSVREFLYELRTRAYR